VLPVDTNYVVMILTRRRMLMFLWFYMRAKFEWQSLYPVALAGRVSAATPLGPNYDRTAEIKARLRKEMEKDDEELDENL